VLSMEWVLRTSASCCSVSGISGSGVLSIFRLLFAIIGSAESWVQLDFEQILTGIEGYDLGVTSGSRHVVVGGAPSIPPVRV
jgi:hypothetical protein